MSLYINHPHQQFDIYVVHSRIQDEYINNLSEYARKLNIRIQSVKVEEDLFLNAPITDRYPKEMYYRLLAFMFLPETLSKVLYLDPDVLVINPIYDLWSLDISDYLFAAAAHTGKTEMSNSINRIRLKTSNDYYNSGVLLINLERCRVKVNKEELFDYVCVHGSELILPDQDVLNAMYGNEIFQIDDSIWNYDARNYSSYLFRSNGEFDIEAVMNNTSIIHFCGRDKPWKKGYRLRFGPLYKHYMSLANRQLTI